MRRPPVSVVLIPSGSPTQLRGCLASLRPQLGVRDEVLAVTPAAAAELRGALTRHRFVRDLGVAADLDAARHAGAAAARHDVVVILDGDTLLGPHCLDAVAAQFDEPDVVAAGPRCFRSAGPQSAQLTQGEAATPAAFHAHARVWRQQHRGKAAAVSELGDVVYAARRDALRAVNSTAAAQRWAALAARGRILVVHEALAAHFGGDDCVVHARLSTVSDLPLLSASLIVKDEEQVLADCLRSLDGLVDEIVVYDTGSTDRTKEIARAHGARVIDGYWDDSFGAARNRCLEHCSGRYVLVIDADEVVQGSTAEVRAAIETSGQDAFHVAVECLSGVGTGTPDVVSIVRVFRRDRCRYAGRLHEQVVDRVLGTPPVVGRLTGLTLRHVGYLAERMAARDKARRNLALAELEAAEQTALHPGLVLSNRARSELLAGRVDESIATCREILAAEPHPTVRRTALVTAAQAELSRDAPATDVLAWLDELRAVSRHPFRADLIEARLRFRDGDYHAVLQLTGEIDTGIDDDGNGYGPELVSGLRAQALFALGRPADAADALLDAAAAGTVELHLAAVIEILAAGGREVGALVERLHDDGWKGAAVQAMQCRPGDGDAVLEAMWKRRPDDRTVLAAAASVAPQLPVLRALEWSSRLRTCGLPADCPLLRLAGDGSRSPRDRAIAAAIAVESFADQRAFASFAAVLPAVPDDQTDAVLEELRLLAPTLATAVEPQPAG